MKLREQPPAPQDDHDADEHDRRSDPIEPVRCLPIDCPAPEKGTDQEDACVRSEDTAVPILWLERLDGRVAEERSQGKKSEKRRRTGTKPAPDCVRATQLPSTLAPLAPRDVADLGEPGRERPPGTAAVS